MVVSVAVVDDDESILDAVRLLLTYEGWSVRGFVTGEACVETLCLYQPDCIILDPHLPGMTGAQLARFLVDEYVQIPIIGLTARPDSPVTQDVISAGAQTILTKPITAETLINAVREALDI